MKDGSEVTTLESTNKEKI